MFGKLKNGFKDFVNTVKTKELTSKNLDVPLADLKMALVRNDVGLAVAQKITGEIKERLLGTRVDRGEKIDEILQDTILTAVTAILHESKPFDMLAKVREKAAGDEPLVLAFLGVNGTGKTTTIAKVANYFKKHNISAVIAASDTFRAGSIEQLEKHAAKVGVKMIKHEYKSDPSSVAYDAIAHAKARHVRVVLIDTAGRQVIDKNLMKEMQKIVKTSDPDYVIYVGDAMAGNDVVTQVEAFSKHVRVDASILTKVDADVSGGAALSVAYMTKKPIVFVGTGQGYDDLVPFDVDWFAKKITDF